MATTNVVLLSAQGPVRQDDASNVNVMVLYAGGVFQQPAAAAVPAAGPSTAVLASADLIHKRFLGILPLGG